MSVVWLLDHFDDFRFVHLLNGVAHRGFLEMLVEVVVRFERAVCIDAKENGGFLLSSVALVKYRCVDFALEPLVGFLVSVNDFRELGA